MEKQKLLKSKQMGKAVFYKPDLNNNYTQAFLKFLLQKKAEDANPRVKRWIAELRRLQGDAEMGILFGSVLYKENYNDVDLLIVIKNPRTAR